MMWLAFPQDVVIEAAKERFKKRFGYEPRIVRRERGLLLVGPIEKKGKEREK